MRRENALSERILITGAASGIGTSMRLGCAARAGRCDCWTSFDPPPADSEAVEIVEASVTDPEAMARTCADVDAVVHLGGHSRENSWAETLSVNIDGTAPCSTPPAEPESAG